MRTRPVVGALLNLHQIGFPSRIQYGAGPFCWRQQNGRSGLHQDGENGFLLIPTVDHLFNKGFISFENSGDLIVSPVADPKSLGRMGIKREGKVNVGAFSEGQRRFLDFHRENVLRMSRRR